jgi:hypothetical protein
MTQEEFDDLYNFYAINSDTLLNEEYMQTHDDWNGIFVHDMWRMIQFIKTDPMLRAFQDCSAIIEAAQRERKAA